MAEHETIADIIAWLRKPREGENAYLTLWRDEIADRLDAAHKRERGNSAALREAASYLTSIFGCDIQFLERHAKELRDTGAYGGGIIEHILHSITLARAALSAPPRNCDVGVPEERIQRWSKFCKARSKKLPPIHGFEWEDYPYESEVAK